MSNSAPASRSGPICRLTTCAAATTRSCWRSVRRSAATCRYPGRELTGVYQAMDYLPLANRVQEGDLEEAPISAAGKHVVIIGGGDTGADCLGTAIRQGPRASRNWRSSPPSGNATRRPALADLPMIFRVSSAHEEGGDRVFSVSTKRFIGENGVLTGLEIVEVEWTDGRPVEIAGTERVIPADLVTLAMGLSVPGGRFLLQMGLERDERGNLVRDDDYATKVPGVFVAGDAGRGQSLIVWAIAEGRAAASSIDQHLMGTTNLPKPLPASARQVTV